MTHLVFDVSGHGFGHLAQTAVAVREVRALLPTARITVRASHPTEVLRGFLPADVSIGRPPHDATLAMHSPIDVDVAASARRYQALHRNWDAVVAGEAEKLAALTPDAVISDVGYVSLAAAARLGVPSYAMCSLDWYGVFRTYCNDCEDFERIAEQILAAYESAEAFLQVAPHMPMDYFPHRIPFGPVARIGRNRRTDLDRKFPDLRGRRFVLFSLGGIPGGPTPADLPQHSELCWVCDDTVAGRANGVIPLGRLGLPFIDAIASADAVVTKPGYGTVVEAVCNGVPVVSVERPDWPETEYMQAWAHRHGRAVFVPRSDQWVEDALGAVLAMLADPGRLGPEPDGAAGIARFLGKRFADTA